jgi:peptidoglycan/LPS O-acetylase OafA/YrhL
MSLVSIPTSSQIAATAGTSRISAFDFIKGALVVIMVFYHWLNYFVGQQSGIYPFLRFLTPSFIFITGFLISKVSLQKPGIQHRALAKKLSFRGLKILVLFTVLNILIVLVAPEVRRGVASLSDFTAEYLTAIFLTGKVIVAGVGKAASFFILVPIGYLLVISGPLVLLSRSFHRAIPYAAVVGVGSVFVLAIFEIKAPILELLTFGLCGAAFGFVPLPRLLGISKTPWLIAGSYLAYVCAIAIWNAPFLLQLLGVPLTLLCIFWVATNLDASNPIMRSMVLAGQYSLFAYVGQIAILQVLFRLVRRYVAAPQENQAAVWGVTLTAGVILTLVAVMGMDRGRRKFPGLDKAYALVFS